MTQLSDPAAQRVIEAMGTASPAPRTDLVPGEMHCAKCKFRLSRRTLYTLSGTVGVGTSETEPCPNGCGPLWPVTWEQEARHCWEKLDYWADRAIAAEEQLKAANERLQRLVQPVEAGRPE